MKRSIKTLFITTILFIIFLSINSIVSAAGNTLDAADGNPANVVFVENNGNVGVNTFGGTQTPATALHITNGDGTTSGLTIGGDLGFGNFVPFQIVHPNTNLVFERRNPDGGLAPDMIFSKTRGSFQFPSEVQFGDRLGIFSFRGHDGVNSLSIGAAFGAEVDGSVELEKVPGKLFFSTTDASGALQERMTINKDGNVGIGTTSPQESLHIKHNMAHGGITLDRDSAITMKSEIDFNQQGNPRWSIGIDGLEDNSDNFFIWQASAENIARLIIDPTGKVGMGINTPKGIFHVNSTEILGNLIDDDFDAMVDEVEHVVFTNNGNVGIGTSTPAVKLDVAGTLKATELVGSWDNSASGFVRIGNLQIAYGRESMTFNSCGKIDVPVTFSALFAELPAVTITPDSDNSSFVYIDAFAVSDGTLSTAGFTAVISRKLCNAFTGKFSWQAIGKWQ